MADEQGPLDEFIDRFKRGQQMQAEALEKINEKIKKQLGHAEPKGAGRGGGPGAPPRKSRRDAPPAEASPVPSSSDTAGRVTYVFIDTIGNQGWSVHFDNGLAVPLEHWRVLYQVLKLLCGPESRSNQPSEGLVPFKTAEELLESISAEGPSITGHCLRQRISRLGKILKGYGYGQLLESGPQGYRIRMREGGQVVDRSG